MIETAGVGSVLAAAHKATRRGGRAVTVGLPNPADTLSISALSLVGDGRTLIGGYMGSAIPARHGTCRATSPSGAPGDCRSNAFCPRSVPCRM